MPPHRSARRSVPTSNLPEAAARRELSALADRVHALKGDIAASLTGLGTLLLDIRARDLCAAGGHASLQGCVTDAFGLTSSNHA